MNKLIVAIGVASVLFSCNIRNTRNRADAMLQNNTPTFADTTTVQLIDSVYDFGNATDGDKVAFNFRFRNTGKKSLIIASAVASCGCTVPEKPEEPIKPGDTGFLKVVFNSQGRVGPVHKTITVTSNAYPKFPLLELKGMVVPAPAK